MEQIAQELDLEGQTYIQQMNQRTGLFFTPDEIEKVRNTTFAIAGFGGVGAITAELLARWGVKKFRLLDRDKYELSNLNRQIFATSKTLDRFKAEVAAERIKEINPFAEIEMIITDRVTNDNVNDFVQGVGIVIQVTDSPSSYLFYNAARKYKVPLVNGYCTETAARVQTFDFSKSDCYCLAEKIKDRIKWRGRKKPKQMTLGELVDFDNKFHHGAVPSINFVTNTTGCLVVAEAIKLITGKGKVCHYPRQINLDLFTLKMKVNNAYSIWNYENYNKFFKFIRKRSK